MNQVELIKPWYRQFWPWFIITLPLCAVIGGIVTIWIAVTHEKGLVTDDYYQKGLDINQQLKLDELARAANIAANLLVSEQNQQVSLYLEGDVPAPDSLILELTSPIDPAKDIRLHLQRSSQNLYQTQLNQAPAGRYYLSLTPADNSWRLKSELTLPSESSIRVSSPNHSTQH